MNFQSRQFPSFEPYGAHRNVWAALKRGFMQKCPNCGRGNLFRRYLKVCDVCSTCGEELYHQRADDAPPYVTILVVGHIVGAGILAVQDVGDAVPLWLNAVIWPVVTVVLCLALLPRFKGALIGLQWANRMHGFGTAPTAPRGALG
jgi:uncharacterized protein (DUF983 family)